MGKITVVEIILRLLASAGVGFALGIQRARSSHPAGVRTHTLVAFGSCVVMITSCIMYYQTVSVYGATPSDPARLGAQVINGIGFLGAGVIMRESPPPSSAISTMYTSIPVSSSQRARMRH